MTLVPQEILEQIPAIGSDPQTPIEKSRVYARLYDEQTDWQWFVLEYDGDATFFGLVVTPILAVAGQFSVRELVSLVSEPGAEDSSVSCDLEFQPVLVGELAHKIPSIRDFLEEPVPREVNQGENLVELSPN